MTSDLKPAEVLKEIKRQLAWRGPSGKPQGHIVLTRVQAEALMRASPLGRSLLDGEVEVLPRPPWLEEPADRQFEELVDLVQTAPVPPMPTPLVQHVTSKELDVLHWLQAEEFSQYGECYGGTLDGLIAKGLAQIHGPGEHQETFIAKDDTATKQKDLMYRAVSLTEAGRKFLEE